MQNASVWLCANTLYLDYVVCIGREISWNLTKCNNSNWFFK